jgi:hypothetical protein
LIEPTDTARAQVAHASSDILASKDPAIAQDPQDVDKKRPIVSMTTQLLHHARRGQRHHPDPQGTGTSYRPQSTSLDPRSDRRRRHPEHLSRFADLGTTVPLSPLGPNRIPTASTATSGGQ